MVFQRLILKFVVFSSMAIFAAWRFGQDIIPPWLLCLGFIFLFSMHVATAVLYTIILQPRLSTLKNLPAAPQPSVWSRLIKEPSPYHFERWINEIPNNGLIRYYGILNMERVLITSPAVVRQILHADAYSFEKQYAQKTHLERVSGRGLVYQEGNVHKLQRNVLDPAFKVKMVRNVFHPSIWSKTCQMLDAVDRETSRPINNESDQTRDLSSPPLPSVQNIINRTLFDITGMVSYGMDFRSITEPGLFFEPLKHYRDAFKPLPANRLRVYLAFVLPDWALNALPIRFNYTSAIGISRFRNIGKNFLARLKKVRPNAERLIEPEIVGTVSVMHKIMAANQLTEEELHNQFMMLQAGGTHTTTAAVMSVIWYLAQPSFLEVQGKLREEIRMKVSPPGTKPVAAETFAQCSYLNAVINEVLRLHPPFTWLGRTPNTWIDVGGTKLPPGLSISLSPWAMHRDKSVWGSDAFEFKPERWLRPQSEQNIPKNNFAWLTFGAGPRRCIGERVARLELQCMIVGLFGRFEFQFDGQMPPRVTHQVTLDFKDEFKVRTKLVQGW